MLKIHNTLSKQKELFKPITPGKVKMYVCGITVYDYCHIGHARSALVFDVVARYFRYLGYEVDFVRNITDVDDKIIQRANENNETCQQLTERFIAAMLEDEKALNMQSYNQAPRATAYIPEIVAMIAKLVEKKSAYVADNGDVYYSIPSFKDYGKLSKRDLTQMRPGERIEKVSEKHNPLDFVLWKLAKPQEPSWQSPWGAGRPGWHIECSVMASKWLGDQIDIHHGAIDLIFPHHENEIAQTEGCSGKDPFVKYWLHNAFLTLSKEKMSKSLGNVFQAREFLTQYSGEIARYLLMSVHYRTTLDFSADSIEQTLTGLQRIYEAKQMAHRMRDRKTMTPDQRAESVWGEFVSSCEKAKKEIEDHYANDFNTAGALGVFFTLIREFNRSLKEPKAQITPAGTLAAGQLLSIMEHEIGDVLGFGKLEPAKALADLNDVRARAPWKDEVSERLSEEEILKLISERKAARDAKDFQKSDEIRDLLKSKGVVLKDAGGSTSWSFE